MEIEFWPEHGSGPLWHEGAALDLAPLVGDDLAERLVRWNAQFSDDKLPIDTGGDGPWLAEGNELLRRVRVALEGRHTVVVTEPWWS